MLNSIRGRLTLSFAAIALLAAFALGAVLITTLQSYYAQRELTYLKANAFAISNEVMKMMSVRASPDEVQSQVDNLAFLSQARVRVYDANKQLLYDSGPPQNVAVNLGVLKQKLAVSQPMEGKLPDDVIGVISPVDKSRKVAPTPDPHVDKSRMVTPIPKSSVDKIPTVFPTPDKAALLPTPMPDPKNVIIYQSMYVVGSPFGMGLSADADPGGVRSSQSVMQSVVNPENGDRLGTLELSEGPAYGHDILTSVAWGWALSSAVAVLVAAGVGWLISHRISAPVLALTAVTTRMAAGDLSSRAELKSQDELGQLARSFNEMANQVETTVSTLRRFVSDAAHELQTPVTALRTNLDLAAADGDSNAQHVFLARAQALAERLDELNSDLLDLSRLEAGVPIHDAASFDLSALLRQHSETFASQAEQAGLTFALQSPDAPVYIRADAGQVLRALANLIDNACKFTPVGGVIRVELKREGARVMYAVSDTGIGVPADDVPQLFNRFHRGRNATPFPGSGLGLAIVKAIMQQQGGQVAVENLSQGARFTLMWYASV